MRRGWPVTPVRKLLRELAGTAAATVLFLAVLELSIRAAYLVRNAAVDYVPLPYVIGHDYGPVPPWVDGLRILEPDEHLIWRNRLGVRRRYIDVFSPVHRQEDRTALLRQFIPSIPASLKGNPVWEIALNSDGFRDREFRREKPSSAFRIVCLGDSWTFGANVGHDEVYARRLEVLLREEHPGANVEVLNLGVLGYTSYQGLQLLKRFAIALEPDVVVLGFAMNDADVAGYRDKDMASYRKAGGGPVQGLASVASRIEIFKLARYAVLLLRHKPKTVGEQLKAKAEAPPGAKDASEYEKLEEWTRVSLGDYEKNLLEMIGFARSRGVPVILLFNELWQESPYCRAMERVAAQTGVPLVDASVLIAGARRKLEKELERRLDLEPADLEDLPVVGGAATSGGAIEVVFRVYLGEHPVPEAVYIAGAHPQLGDLQPNVVAMHDDGTGGDQRAEDGVWSYAAALSPGTRVCYVYTNSGKKGEWEGLDVPAVRQFTVESGGHQRRMHRPIDSFGGITMQADSWHPNAAGYELIAGALFGVIEKNEEFMEWVQAR